jgi:hypothetical protein
VTKIDVQPEALHEAARILYAGVHPSVFSTMASGSVGPLVANACDAFVKRLERAGMTNEIVGLARALELASGTYVSTDTAIAQKASGRGD